MADFGKLNLSALRHKVVEFSKKGSTKKVKCVVIPIDENHLFLSDKGNIFLDIVAFKMKVPQTDKDGAVTQSHMIKQSLPKAVREAMSDDDKKSQPILGGIAIFESGGSNIEKEYKTQSTSFDAKDDEDLPF